MHLTLRMGLSQSWFINKPSTNVFLPTSHSSAALTNIFRVKLFAEGHRRADKSVCLVLIITTQLIIHRMSLPHHIYLFPFALHSLFPLVQGNQMLSHFTTTSNLSLTSFSLSYIASFMSEDSFVYSKCTCSYFFYHIQFKI